MRDELLLTIQNLEYRFQKGREFCLHVNDLECSFNGITGLYGLSGSGKTTFSRLLAGLIKQSTGSINFKDTEKSIVPHVVYSPQFPENILLGIQVEDSVREILAINKQGKNATDLIQEYLERFDLDFQTIRNKNGFELSGGELRRLAIAMGLALSPDLLILDEPTIGLDRNGKGRFYSILEEFQKEHHIMIVTHDFNLIRKMCKRFWILDKGQVIFNGDVATLNNQPAIIQKAGIDALDHYFAISK